MSTITENIKEAVASLGIRNIVELPTGPETVAVSNSEARAAIKGNIHLVPDGAPNPPAKELERAAVKEVESYLKGEVHQHAAGLTDKQVADIHAGLSADLGLLHAGVKEFHKNDLLPVAERLTVLVGDTKIEMTQNVAIDNLKPMPTPVGTPVIKESQER